MKVKIQSVKFDADEKLIAYVEGKMNRLERFHDGITTAEVTLSLENVVKDSHKKVAVRLEIPGESLFAERSASTFEHALDLSIDALKSQIAKAKEKF